MEIHKYGDERRSFIEYSGGDVSIEDLIADENVVITISCISNVLILRNTN
jgi:DNA gyrase/topoisomerase IV subunit A